MPVQGARAGATLRRGTTRDAPDLPLGSARVLTVSRWSHMREHPSSIAPRREKSRRHTEGMKIRARRDDDLDDLLSLAGRVRQTDNYPISLPDGDFVRFLTRPQSIAAWVAADGSQILGHVALSVATSRLVMELVDRHGSPSPPCTSLACSSILEHDAAVLVAHFLTMHIVPPTMVGTRRTWTLSTP